MSHVTKIEIEINDLGTLKAACRRLELQFICNQKTYAWYGQHVGDYPVPEGFSVEDMGKCDHAIRVPGAAYEIGVVKRGHKYVLLWDSYHSGGLERTLGKNAGKLNQAYGVERATKVAKLRGYHVHELRTTKGIRLMITRSEGWSQ
jgi:hypothetical protein